MLKRCSGYKPANIKPHYTCRSNFGIERKSKDGLHHKCKACKDVLNSFNNKNKFGPDADPEVALSHKIMSASQRASKLKRTPKWLTKEDHSKIRAIYRQSMELTKETGIQHHVDHVIPMQGETVSGLHVPDNLQIITAEENLRKNNKYED